MAGAIQTPAATPEYRDNFGRAMRRSEERPAGHVLTHVCERCGKSLKVTSECACSAMRVGGTSARACGRCGRSTGSASARLCDYCEFHHGGRRR